MSKHVCRYCGEPAEWCCNTCDGLLCEMHARDVRQPDGGIVVVCMGQCYTEALRAVGKSSPDRILIDKSWGV